MKNSGFSDELENYAEFASRKLGRSGPGWEYILKLSVEFINMIAVTKAPKCTCFPQHRNKSFWLKLIREHLGERLTSTRTPANREKQTRQLFPLFNIFNRQAQSLVLRVQSSCEVVFRSGAVFSIYRSEAKSHPWTWRICIIKSKQK